MANTNLNAQKAREGERSVEEDDVLKVEGASPAIKRKAPRVEEFDADDLERKPVALDGLKALQSMAEELIVCTREVVRASNALKAAQGALKSVQEERLPDLMEANGLTKFEFIDRTTGLTLTIKLESGKFRVMLPAIDEDEDGNPNPLGVEKRHDILEWLRSIGLQGIIDKELKVKLNLLDDEIVAEIVAELKKMHPELDSTVKEGVHQKRLQSQVNRLLKDGQKVHEALIVEPIRKANVAKK
jgi:hypothetical protein